VSADLVEIEVKDAGNCGSRWSFLGSPSIRIDGRDVEISARTSRAFGFGCRTYLDEGERAGSSARDMDSSRRAGSKAVRVTERLAPGGRRDQRLSRAGVLPTSRHCGRGWARWG